MAIMKSLLTQLRRPANTRSATSHVSNGKLDIVSRLPFELHIFILSLLGPNDVDAGLSACRRWRTIWLSDEIWPKLARRWFPNLEDYIRKAAVSDAEMGEIFRRTLHKIQRRMSGRFASALHHELTLESERFFTLSKGVPVLEGGVHSYDDVDGLEVGTAGPITRSRRFMMYDNGRIAWWPEAYPLPCLAVVDDLRTRKRRTYLFPGHEDEKRGYKTAMSNKLLLIGRGKTLHAWHLDLDQHSSVEVPEEFVRCTTEGETVILITKNACLFAWKFGQELEYIDTTGCYDKGPVGIAQPYDFLSGQYITSYNVGSRFLRTGILLDFIISPIEDNVLFVITYTPAPLRELRIDEIRNGEIAETYRLDESEWSHLMEDPADFTNLRWEKVDSYGGYCLMQAVSKTPDITRDSACPPCSSILVSVCFNIYTKSFTISHYHHRDGFKNQSVSQIRNNRIAASDTDDPRGLLLTLRPCGSTSVPRDKPSPTPFYTMAPGGRDCLLRLQRVPPDSDEWDADFALDTSPLFGPVSIDGVSDGRLPIPGVKRLVGDDDFLLLVVHQSYIVWSFGNEIPGNTADAGRSRWRKLIH
ncbi:hypothetical protein F4776DRAFT_638286 [Hypoxylon sp. NC0597]|nr:hypothetical protein F4776DRAFT_638286 [Hypoxylon sp. NC0597]